MIRSKLGRPAAVILAAALGVGVVLAPVPASAGVITIVEFETQGPVSVSFGDNWYLRLSVTSTYEDGPTLPMGPNDGTVDVYFSGIAGPFAAGLPIQSDGLVYVSQPESQALLSAGEYQVSAIFNPAEGGYFESSQTTTLLSLTVTALDLTPRVEVVNDAAVSERPVITASLGGSYVDTNGGAPAGTWHFIVTDADDQPVFDESFALAQGSTEPLRVEIDAKLAKGESYTVVSAFSPVDELAGGLTVGDPADATFQTPGGTLGEAITAPVPMPVWLAVLMLLVLLGVAATAVVLGVKLRGHPAVKTADESPVAPRLPGDPYNVELASLDELGLPEPETIPELIPEGQTQKLPASTTWLLSDVEPATNLPDASEAPTERLDAITAEELPTEIISTDDDEATKP